MSERKRLTDFVFCLCVFSLLVFSFFEHFNLFFLIHLSFFLFICSPFLFLSDLFLSVFLSVRLSLSLLSLCFVVCLFPFSQVVCLLSFLSSFCSVTCVWTTRRRHSKHSLPRELSKLFRKFSTNMLIVK